MNNFLRDECQEDAEKNCDHWCESSDRGSQWGSLYRQKNLIMPGQSIKKHATEALILLAVYTVNVLKFQTLFSICSQIRCSFSELEFKKDLAE